MPKYIVGQTYKGIISEDKEQNFVILEEDAGIYGIRWDDGCEEWAYESDMDYWTKAAKKRKRSENSE